MIVSRGLGIRAVPLLTLPEVLYFGSEVFSRMAEHHGRITSV
jgi:hypothetical protein